jgi:hypothetical protein
VFISHPAMIGAVGAGLDLDWRRIRIALRCERLAHIRGQSNVAAFMFIIRTLLCNKSL